MARITGHAEMFIPHVMVNDVALFVPIDLPEGGELQIILGTSAIAPPSLKMPLPRGCAVGMLDPETVNKFLPQLREDKRIGEHMAAELPNVMLYAIPLLKPLWFPKGGFLQVVVGELSNLPTPSTPVAAGALLAIIPPEPAEVLRRGFKDASRKQNPFAITEGAPR